MSHSPQLTRQFEELFKKNYSKLYYVALDWVEDEESAKDLVNDLFAELWKQYERLQDENVEGYLFQSLRNRCINYIEHLNYIGRYLDHMPHSEVEHLYATNLSISANSANSADPTSADGSVLQQLLNTVLNNLPDRQQEAYRYVRLNDCTLQSAAEEMNISISAVAKLVNKASEKVKAYIQKHYPTDF